LIQYYTHINQDKYVLIFIGIKYESENYSRVKVRMVLRGLELELFFLKSKKKGEVNVIEIWGNFFFFNQRFNMPAFH